MGFSIAKEFGFDYGHRVWTQSLNQEYSLDNACVCRHLHGHRGTVMVYLKGDDVEPNGMVTDFKHLNWFKKFVDDALDHKMILDENDPLLPELFPELFDNKSNILQAVIEPIDKDHYYRSVAPWCYEGISDAKRELYEGLVFVNFIPTSENLSRWMYRIVEHKMKKINVKVDRIQFYETPKSQSNYSDEKSINNKTRRRRGEQTQQSYSNSIQC